MNETTLIPLLNKYELGKKEINIISQSILSNKLVIKYNYFPKSMSENDVRLIFTKDTFKWENDFGEYTNLAMLHLHSLEPISYLLVGFHLTGNINYLEKSYEIFFDWCNHAKSSNHFYLWYRHCVSDRALILSQLFLLKEKLNLTQENNSVLYDMFFKHKNYLLDNNNYVLHNHGALMDIGLIALAIVSEDRVTLDYSHNRITSNFKATFTDNMICVENSVSYSLYNLEQFIKCEKYLLVPIDKSILENFDEYIRKGLDFFDLIKQPNGSFPHIGDGERINLENIKQTVIFKYYSEHNLFFNNNSSAHKIYYDEGYAVFKDNSSYIFITAGDIKKNHKHADDLSFVLFYEEDIFIDPGIYSYDNNIIRQYLSSSMAHNTITLDNESYDYINKNNASIISYKSFDDYHYIVLKSSNYEFANIYRHMYIMKTDFTIILHDEVFAEDKLFAIQNFNLGLNLSNENNFTFSQNKIILNNKVQIKSDKNSILEIQNGNNPYLINAIYSEKFHDIKPIKKLSISQYSENPVLTTIISNTLESQFEIISNIRNEDYIDIKMNSKVETLYKENLSKNSEKLEDPILKIVRDRNIIYCETVARYYEKQEYAWDIFKNNEKEKVIWYQESNKFEYKLESTGIYTIRCYVRNVENDEEKSAFVSSRKVRL